MPWFIFSLPLLKILGVKFLSLSISTNGLMLRLSILLLALFVSCQRKETGTVKKDVERTDSIFVDTTQNKRAADVAVNTSQPLPKIEILFAGIFHGDEVKENIEDLPWLGLFADDNGDFVFTKTKIIAVARKPS